jgi:hypothetical protein
VIPVFGQLKHKDSEFQAKLGYVFKKKERKKKKCSYSDTGQSQTASQEAQGRKVSLYFETLRL